MSQFDESKHNRHSDGKFANKPHSEAPDVNLQTLRRPTRTERWSVDDYEWDTEHEAADDLEATLSQLSGYDADHKGYLMAAQASSRYGSIGLPGKGTGYKVTDTNLLNTLQGLGDLQAVTEAEDGALVVETANHDYTQTITVYPIPTGDHDGLADADWGELEEATRTLTPMSFTPSQTPKETATNLLDAVDIAVEDSSDNEVVLVAPVPYPLDLDLDGPVDAYELADALDAYSADEEMSEFSSIAGSWREAKEMREQFGEAEAEFKEAARQLRKGAWVLDS